MAPTMPFKHQACFLATATFFTICLSVRAAFLESRSSCPCPWNPASVVLNNTFGEGAERERHGMFLPGAPLQPNLAWIPALAGWNPDIVIRHTVSTPPIPKDTAIVPRWSVFYTANYKLRWRSSVTKQWSGLTRYSLRVSYYCLVCANHAVGKKA